jgi:hypothetical protein
LAAALAGCSGESGTTDYSGDNTYKDPLKNPAPVGCTVSYQTGNGKGISPKSELITKDDPISLPDATGLEALQEGAVFVGWNDGLLTYPADYKYTVTKNVTFKARWAFTTLGDITTHLSADNGNPVLISVADAEPADETLTWEALLSAIQTAGETGKTVELDLTGSTLALVNENKFDYKDGGDTKNTGEQYIKKLLMPSAATLIASIFKSGPFSRLEAASGLNISAIPAQAFDSLSNLAAIGFPAAKSIENYAFYCCGYLTEVRLPAAESIGQYAFQYCINLTSVKLPAAETIGMYAFQNCNKLTEVSLPEAETIEFYAFQYCASLTSVNLPAAKNIRAVVFQNCTSLTEVSLPEAETIGDTAFQNCINLTSVKLPVAKSIGGAAFQYCGDLTSVNLKAAKTISSAAFQFCTGLSNITIGEDCTINDSTIRGNFQTYYNGTDGHAEKAAGSYTYNSGTSSWSYKEL